MGLRGSGICVAWLGWSGALVGVMERMRCFRWPCGWGSLSGCRSILVLGVQDFKDGAWGVVRWG